MPARQPVRDSLCNLKVTDTQDSSEIVHLNSFSFNDPIQSGRYVGVGMDRNMQPNMTRSRYRNLQQAQLKRSIRAQYSIDRSIVASESSNTKPAEDATSYYNPIAV